MYRRGREVIEGVLSQCTHKVLRQAQEYISEFLNLYITGDMICGAVEGRFGIYSQAFSLDPEMFYVKCDCPSVHSMCKHIVALGLLYLSDEEAFTDIDKYKDILMNEEKESLIRLVCSIFAKYPETYKVFEINYKELKARAIVERGISSNKKIDYVDKGFGI